MTLQTSGMIDASAIWYEWDKTTPPPPGSLDVDLNEMGSRFGVGGGETEVRLDEFYGKRIIKCDVSSWIDPNSYETSSAGFYSGSSASYPISEYFYINHRYLGYASGPNFDASINWSSLSMDFDDKGTGNSLDVYFEYDKGAGWQLLKHFTIVGVGTGSWTAGSVLITGLDSTAAQNIRFRIYYQMGSSPTTETFNITPSSGSFSISIENIIASNTKPNIVDSRDTWNLTAWTGNPTSSTTSWTAGIN